MAASAAEFTTTQRMKPRRRRLVPTLPLDPDFEAEPAAAADAADAAASDSDSSDMPNQKKVQGDGLSKPKEDSRYPW